MNERLSTDNAAVRPEAVPRSEPLIKAGWLRCLLFLVVYFIFVSVGGFIGWAAVGMPETSSLTRIAGTTDELIMQAVILASSFLAVLMFRRLVDRRSLVSLGFSLGRGMWRDFLAGLASGIVLMSAVFWILYLLGCIHIQSVHWPIGDLAMLFLFCFIVGSQEEIVFRGYLLNNLLTSANKYLSLLAVSVLFALFHALNPNLSVAGLLNIVLAGLLLGIYYVHRRNLWFPIGLHLTWNFFQGAVYGIPVSGVSFPSLLEVEVTGHKLLTGGQFGFEASLLSSAAVAVATVLVHVAYRQRRT